ncbi:MAG: hypothetical protein V1897_07660 [Pseudomonadota bacterium]
MNIHGVGTFVAAVFFSFSTGALAYEFSGKLERLDFNSVTLLGKDSDKKIGRICNEQRTQAARFLGKSVRVNLEQQHGEDWVVSLEALKQ